MFLTLKTIRLPFYEWILNVWMNRTKWSCPRLLLFFPSLCRCWWAFIIIKSDIGSIYYSARYAETGLVVLLCSWLTFRLACYVHVMYIEGGQEWVYTHVTIKREMEGTMNHLMDSMLIKMCAQGGNLLCGNGSFLF